METKTAYMWSNRGSSTRNSGHLYGFMIVGYDFETGVFEFEDLGTNKAIGSAVPIAPNEYFFPTPPKVISLAEPTTTVVKPLQGRGYTIETQGVLIRPLNISGTTGFRPAATISPPSGVFGQTAPAIAGIIEAGQNFADYFTTDRAGAFPSGPPTGYFNFMQLRNLFRRYNWLRSHMAVQDKYVPYLVWVNYHEFEFWVCEPGTFDTQRTSKSPLTFTYNITAKCLFKLQELVPSYADNPLRYLSAPYGAMQRVRGAINQLGILFDQIAQLPDAVVGDMQALALQVIETGTQLIRATSNLVGAFSPAARTNRWDRLAKAVSEACDNFLTAWNSIDDGFEGEQNSYENIETQQNVRDMARIADRIQGASATLRTSGTAQSNRASGISSQYGGNSSNFSVEGARTTVIQLGETIEDISERELGSISRWMELIVANDLIYPYITVQDSEGTLSYGDTILIPGLPEASGNGENIIVSSPIDFENKGKEPDVRGLTAAATFGRDLRVFFTKDSIGGMTLEFKKTRGGDIDDIEGVDNFKQAMVMRSNTEKGDLKEHKSYGFAVPIGEMATHSSAALWAVDVEQSIKGDARVASIKNIAVAVNGDVFMGRVEVIGQSYLAQFPITTIQGGS